MKKFEEIIELAKEDPKLKKHLIDKANEYLENRVGEDGDPPIVPPPK